MQHPTVHREKVDHAFRLDGDGGLRPRLRDAVRVIAEVVTNSRRFTENGATTMSSLLAKARPHLLVAEAVKATIVVTAKVGGRADIIVAHQGGGDRVGAFGAEDRVERAVALGATLVSGSDVQQRGGGTADSDGGEQQRQRNNQNTPARNRECGTPHADATAPLDGGAGECGARVTSSAAVAERCTAQRALHLRAPAVTLDPHAARWAASRVGAPPHPRAHRATTTRNRASPLRMLSRPASSTSTRPACSACHHGARVIAGLDPRAQQLHASVSGAPQRLTIGGVLAACLEIGVASRRARRAVRLNIRCGHDRRAERAV